MIWSSNYLHRIFQAISKQIKCTSVKASFLYNKYYINVYVESQQATTLREINVQRTWRKIFPVKFNMLASNII